MSEDIITIEVNGQSLPARKGAMLIEITDANNIYIPRFCYHPKLSVAANCRMCLVEVEKAPKPLPACATPVFDGMKVFTRSRLAVDAQQAVMEFLLINHPLDCPICDQGGECELQDVAMGYGRGVSRYTERKRVVKDKDIGPLVQTEMTRCIHCTRCVRFGEEIAGLRELGATGRGEHMEIGTYVEKSMISELSGNVIDLCPVGALTDKPFRYSARSWEMRQYPSIAPHDSVGSNVHVHVKGQIVKRVVPAENEAINEVWLSDRDRYSRSGLHSPDRLLTPLVKENGEWQEVDWEIALAMVRDRLQAILDRDGADAIGGLAAPWATLEELYLFQKWLRGMGVRHIDHRLRQADFRDDSHAPAYPALGQPLAELEHADAVLLLGSYPRKEQPLVNHRLRKAALRGASIMALNPVDFDFNYELAVRCIVAPSRMTVALAGIAGALLENGGANESLRRLVAGVEPDEVQRAMAERLQQAERPTVLLGMQAIGHPEFSTLRALAGEIATMTGARFGYLPEAANSNGAWLTGVIPHRGPAGEAIDTPGLDACRQLQDPRKAYLLLGMEPALDCWNPQVAVAALEQAECVVAFCAYRDPVLLEHAEVLLPMGLFTETAGSFINAEGLVQTFNGAVAPPGMARPAWKVLRVLGNVFDLEGFEYQAADEVTTEINAVLSPVVADNNTWLLPAELVAPSAVEFERISWVPTNSLDPLVRHAAPLQATADTADGHVHVHPGDAARLGCGTGDRLRVQQSGRIAELPVQLNASLPSGCIMIHAAQPVSAELGGWFGSVELQRVAGGQPDNHA